MSSSLASEFLAAARSWARREPMLAAAAAVSGVCAAAALFMAADRWASASAAELEPAAAGGSGALSKYEAALEADMIPAAALAGCGFESIGGLESQRAALDELVILPLARPELFAHSAVAARPSGVLLYGPPGTGKTLLAKAIAARAASSFLSANVASLQSKFFGETPKLVEALFSLARRRAPCVVFIDEIDGFLGTRHDMDQQHVNVMKTKFMENWDGLSRAASAAEAANAWVLVIGATNKPWAVDPAILRRMPRQIYVGMPDAGARAAILRVLLRGERVDEALAVERVAEATEGYSGSDLKELVRAASMGPIREALRLERAGGGGGGGSGAAAGAPPARGAPPRGMRIEDFAAALDSVRPTGQVAAQYKYEQLREGAWAADAGRGGGAARGALAAGVTPKGASPPTRGSGGGESPDEAAARALMTFGPSVKANSAALADAIQRHWPPTS